MQLSKRRIQSFQRKIFSWWATHARDLPWRRTDDPYRVMVSEVMLQQTQVRRVLSKYAAFIDAFPTVDALAHASPSAVLRMWKGMGYNRRALYLKRAANIIVEEFHGEIPKSEELLLKLPGLGIYTARAILVFAYKQEVSLIDTNIRNIITHVFFNGKPQKASVIEGVAKQLLPKGKSWEWHQALMDYAAMELQKGNGKRKKAKKNTIPFRDSNRFYRGRIIDRLREGTMREQNLIGEFAGSYGKSKVFIARIIRGLIKDGLAQRTSRGFLRLPEEHAR